MSLIDKARQLAAKLGASSGTAVAGALMLAPLADAVQGALVFNTPTLNIMRVAPDNTTDFSSFDNTMASLLSGGSHLKIFGLAGSDANSGSLFTHRYRWEGPWTLAPAAGEIIDVHLDASANFTSPDLATTAASWTFEVDLNADGTPEFSANNSVTGVDDPVMTLSAVGSAVAPIAGASMYRIDIHLSQTLDELYSGFPPFGVNLDIPNTSIDLIAAVPETSSLILTVGAGVVMAGGALLRRWL